MIKYYCPKCGHRLRAWEELAHYLGICTSCRALHTIPEESCRPHSTVPEPVRKAAAEASLLLACQHCGNPIYAQPFRLGHEVTCTQCGRTSRLRHGVAGAEPKIEGPETSSTSELVSVDGTTTEKGTEEQQEDEEHAPQADELSPAPLVMDGDGKSADGTADSVVIDDEESAPPGKQTLPSDTEARATIRQLKDELETVRAQYRAAKKAAEEARREAAEWRERAAADAAKVGEMEQAPERGAGTEDKSAPNELRDKVAELGELLKIREASLEALRKERDSAIKDAESAKKEIQDIKRQVEEWKNKAEHAAEQEKETLKKLRSAEENARTEMEKARKARENLRARLEVSINTLQRQLEETVEQLKTARGETRQLKEECAKLTEKVKKLTGTL